MATFDQYVFNLCLKPNTVGVITTILIITGKIQSVLFSVKIFFFKWDMNIYILYNKYEIIIKTIDTKYKKKNTWYLQNYNAVSMAMYIYIHLKHLSIS